MYDQIPVERLWGIPAEFASRAFEPQPEKIEETIREGGLFDAGYYASAYPDVSATGIDPLEHYAACGWREGRMPNGWFDSSFYLEDNPDIAMRVTNPLLHFLCAGFREGRRPNPEARKNGRKLVAAILGGGSSFSDIALLLKKLGKEARRPDSAAIALSAAGAREMPSGAALLSLFPGIMRIRLDADPAAASQFAGLLADLRGNVTVFAQPLASVPPGWLGALSSALQAAPGQIHALSWAYAAFANGGMAVSRKRLERLACVPIPLLPCGVVIPAETGESLLARLPLFQNFAPDHPSLWLAAQMLLDKQEAIPPAVTPAAQPSVDHAEEAQFREQLAALLRALLPELADSPIYGDLKSFFQQKDHATAYENRMVDIGPCVVSQKRFDWINQEKFRRELTKKEIKDFISYKYYNSFGYNIDFERPCTFNEKLNWLKVFYHNPIMHVIADKVRFHEFVLSRLPEYGDHCIHPATIFHRPQQIYECSLKKFPDKFLLKANFGSGAQAIIEKRSFDRKTLRPLVQRWFDPNRNHYFAALEYGYKGIKPAVVCEPFITFDYKIEFFCFDGKPLFYWMVVNDKTKDVHASLYDLDGRELPIRWHYPNIIKSPPRPPYFSELMQVCRILSKGFPHVRVDFYAAKNTWYFSEMTFYTWAALKPFSDPSFDALLGDKIPLQYMEDDEIDPVANAKALKEAEYALGVFERYLAEFPAERIAGANILEIGPDQNLGVALLFKCLGAANVHVVDKFPKPWKKACHQPVYMLIAQKARERWPHANLLPLYEAARYGHGSLPIHILADDAESLAQVPSQSIDFIGSWAVLEHIYNPPAVFRRLGEISRPGGIGVHQVDFRDHLDFKRPLEFLLHSCRWREPASAENVSWMRARAARANAGAGNDMDLDGLIVHMCSCFGNGYRHVEYDSLWEAGGFKILAFAPDCFASDTYLDEFMPRLSASDSSAKNMPREILRILSGKYVVEKQ